MIDTKHKVISFPGSDQTEADSTTKEQSSVHTAPQDTDTAADAASKSESEDRAEESQNDLKSILLIELPTALAEREVKLYIFAIAAALLGIVTSISLASPQCLIFLIFAAFFVYVGISSRIDFKNGDIVELSLLCFNVQKTSRLSSDYYISFCTAGETPTYYRFQVRDKKGVFFPGCPYLIYYHKRNPAQLLAYYQL